MSWRPLITALAAGAASVPSPEAQARDFGQHGAVFAIAEPDLLEVIHRRLLSLQASGALSAANRAFAARTVASVRRPAPVAGIGPARAARAWLVDPSVTAPEDLRDAAGRVVVSRGTRVNPLDTVRLRAPLVFLDGDDPEQVAWATGRGTSPAAKLILVRGAPLELMRTHLRRFYFDQAGTLTTRLGIRAVPAMVVQQGRALAVRELVLAAQGDAR